LYVDISVKGFNVVPSVYAVGAFQDNVTLVALVTVRVEVPETPLHEAVITVEPALTAVASPFEPAALLTVATPVLEELQVAEAVRSCVVPFENVPTALNCSVVPLAMEGLLGVTAMEDSVAAVTVSVVDPEIPPDAAVTVVEPVATGVARPCEPPALLMLAMVVDDEPHVTVVVRFCVEPSEYVPVAVNCLVVPSAILGLAGVIAMETSVDAVIVSVVDTETAPDAAEMVVAPVATAVANPFEPAALLMVATDDADELHVTVVVRLCVDPSE
jgi:hypothetical protein